MNDVFSEAVSVLPDRIKLPVIKAYKCCDSVYEIRFVKYSSVYFYNRNGVSFVCDNGMLDCKYSAHTLKPGENELEEIVNRAMGYSGFLYDREIKEGFVTYGCGLRMGICTSGGGKNFGLGNINSLVIRLPCFEEPSENNMLDELLMLCSKGLLIAGAPASGKTTMLRIIAKKLSDGCRGAYKKVTVIDERGELSAGKPLGVCTDIIKGKEKSQAILHALRLLSPQYIICDEIGNVDETKAITEGLNSGVSFVASIHASDMKELLYRSQFRLLFAENVFGAVAFLSSDSPGKISKIYTREEIHNEINRTCNHMHFNNTCKFLSFGTA